MKPELAELLAATAGNDLPVDRAKAVIEEYLRRLARCAVCDNTGNYLYRRNVDGPRGAYIPAMTEARCPNCAGMSHDPDYFGWHCFLGKSKEDCASAKKRRDASEGDHSDCGERVLVPLPAIPKPPG